MFTNSCPLRRKSAAGWRLSSGCWKKLTSPFLTSSSDVRDPPRLSFKGRNYCTTIQLGGSSLKKVIGRILHLMPLLTASRVGIKSVAGHNCCLQFIFFGVCVTKLSHFCSRARLQGAPMGGGWGVGLGASSRVVIKTLLSSRAGDVSRGRC